ncbi:DUF3566 domain-containing protein [Actinoallomurus purpureus]|uniref:DUF3566 domain-containing protein n=1 Tax=Actinoallomurus purpureus TaxID=478114 RepID=UPI0027E22F73|nr:DUF3566 domain-containing protein [Actinoallomurus purpureus]
MTANAGKGADGESGRTTGTGGKSGQGKKPSAAKKPTDEVTVKKTDDTADGGEPADKAEETVIDMAAKKDGTEDTVMDLKLPSKKPDPTGEAVGSKDRLVSRGALSSTGDGSAKEKPKPGDPGSASGRTTSMDIPKTSPGFGGTGSTTGTAPSYGPRPTTTLEPAPRPAGATPPDKPVSRKAPRKAHLQVARFEPWSVMKFSFIMSLVCFLVLFVAVFVLYLILSGLGVFDALTNTIRDLQGKTNGNGGLNPAGWFSAARILGYTALIGTLNVLLITALATVWSVIYNMAADLVGGVEVTLKEAEQ